MAEGDACPRCEVGVLEVDDVDGFILCPSCGFVADDAPVLTAQQGPGEERGGFIVAEDDGGGRAAGGRGLPHAVLRLLPHWSNYQPMSRAVQMCVLSCIHVPIAACQGPNGMIPGTFCCAAALGGGSAWQHGVHSQGGSYSHRTMKKALDNLQAAASTLKLASHQIEEAQAILRQVGVGVNQLCCVQVLCDVHTG